MTDMWHTKHSCVFTVDYNDYGTDRWVFLQSSQTSWALILWACWLSVICFIFSLFSYLPSDGSDLDTVSHGSLDSANDSVERTSIDTDFTKMDSSDDGFSTGTKPQPCFFVLQTILSFNCVTAAPRVWAYQRKGPILNRFDLITNYMNRKS